MGLEFFQVPPKELDTLRPLIVQHESDVLGPRARGFWFERPERYDYAGVQVVAVRLHESGVQLGLAHLELSENEAHSLSLLELELPGDSLEFPPALFMVSAAPDMIRKFLRVAHRKLGATPEEAAARIDASVRDPRMVGYFQKQVRHLRVALPKVWRFYEDAAQSGNAVLAIDLRARDLEIPEPAELAALLAQQG